MLTFKKTLFSFAIALLLLLVADYYLDLTIVFYLLLLLAFLSVVFYGSYFIDSNFHIKVLCNAPAAKNEVALSFDDGPIANNTERILDILKLNHVPATFFCIGHRINSNEQLFKRIVSEGHTIGNHSYSHHFFFDLFSANRMKQELIETNAAAEKITSKKMKLFRPPYGVTTPDLAKAVSETGMQPLGWSLRSMDTVIKDEAKLVLKIKNNLKSGDIILLHDTAAVTLAALQQIINEIKAKGFKIVRIDQLLNIEPYA